MTWKGLDKCEWGRVRLEARRLAKAIREAAIEVGRSAGMTDGEIESCMGTEESSVVVGQAALTISEAGGVPVLEVAARIGEGVADRMAVSLAEPESGSSGS